MVNAAQTVSLHQAAPGRTMAAFGRGFSTCAAIGQPPIEWSYMKAYIRAYQALLAGQVVDWEGQPIKLMLTSVHANALPLQIPLLVASVHPEGAGLAQTVGADGLISIAKVIPEQRDFGRAVVAVMGTVIDEQEDPIGERVRLAVGAPWAAATYHLIYTFQGAEAVHQMPGGSAWLNVIEKFPQRERHLHVHQGHMVEMNDADLAAWRAGGHVSLSSATLSGSADTLRRAVAAMAQAGATEVLYEPSGPDIARELKAFISAVHG